MGLPDTYAADVAAVLASSDYAVDAWYFPGGDLASGRVVRLMPAGGDAQREPFETGVDAPEYETVVLGRDDDAGGVRHPSLVAGDLFGLPHEHPDWPLLSVEAWAELTLAGWAELGLGPALYALDAVQHQDPAASRLRLVRVDRLERTGPELRGTA